MKKSAKVLLAALAVLSATAGFASEVEKQKSLTFGVNTITSTGSTGLEVNLTKSMGDNFDLGFSAGKAGSRTYLSAAAQTKSAELFEGVRGSLGFGVARTSTNWDLTPIRATSQTGFGLDTLHGDGVETKYAPFVNAELSHKFKSGPEVYVQAKWFSGFSSQSAKNSPGVDGNDNPVFAGVGVRMSF